MTEHRRQMTDDGEQFSEWHTLSAAYYLSSSIGCLTSVLCL
jgi:hypothetical protein